MISRLVPRAMGLVPDNRKSARPIAVALAAALVGMSCTVAFAQEMPSTPTASSSDDQLAEDEYDPTARLTQFQIKNIYTSAEYGTNAQPNTLQMRTVLALNPFWFLPLPQLIRPTWDIKTVPNGAGAATSTGYDDMQLLDLFLLPWPNARETKFRWGLGPYFVFPTSTNSKIGNGVWQMGPAFAFGYRGISGLQIAGLMQQATSFAYTSSKSVPVTSVTFQPILTYRLENGWYLKSSDATWTFNLRHTTSTTIPLSAGFGKVWKLNGGYALDTSVSGQWMAYRQFAQQTEQTTINFELTLLLPELRL